MTSTPAIQSFTDSKSSRSRTDTYLKGGGFSNDTTIVIVGMRGAGKTTVGLISSTYLGRPLIDSDRVFEKLHNTSIKNYVIKHGWQSFRDQETAILKNLVHKHSTGAVIVLGGGVVDSPENVAFLRSLSVNRTLIVLHVRRQMEDVFSYLSKVDASRTTWHTLGESYRAVWAKRSVLLEECSNFTFVSLTVAQQRDAPPLHQSLSLKHVEKSLQRFLRSLFPNKYPPNICPLPKFSWSAPRITTLAVSENDPAIQDEKLLQEICQGADIVSYIVRLSESSRNPSTTPTPRSSPPISSDEEDTARICLQVARVSQHTSRPVNFVPLIPNANQPLSAYIQRVALGFKLACPFIEISLELSDDDIMSLLTLPRSSQTKILMSDTFYNPISWKNTVITDMYNRAVRLGADLVRLYKQASSEFDCFEALQLQDEIASIPFTEVPLSAITLGRFGKMSHYLDPIINPIGHPRLAHSKSDGILDADSRLLTFSDRHTAHLLAGITRTKVVHEFNIGPYEPRPYPIDMLSIFRLGFEALPMPFSVETATARHINGDTETISPSVLKRLINQSNFAAAIINVSLIDDHDASIKLGYLKNDKLEEISLSARKTGYADFVMLKQTSDLSPMRIFLPDGGVDSNSSNNPQKAVFDNLNPIALSRCICDNLSPVNAIGRRSCAVIYGATGRLGREILFALNLANVPKVFAANCDHSIELVADPVKEEEGNKESGIWKSCSTVTYLEKLTDLDAHDGSNSSHNHNNNHSQLAPSIVILASLEDDIEKTLSSSFQFPKLLTNSLTGGVIVNLSSIQLPTEIASMWSIITRNDLAMELCKVSFKKLTEKPLPIVSSLY